MAQRRIFSLLASTEGKERWWCQPLCTWSVCLLHLFSPQVPFKGAQSGLQPHLGDGRSPQKGAFGLLSCPLLAVFKDMSLLRRHLVTLSDLHLPTSGPKTVAFNRSSRRQVSCGVGQLVFPCIRLKTKQKEARASLHGLVMAIRSFRMGCFA